MSIGERIKLARSLKGYSQAELSERCGWEHQSRISSYERDKREPDKEDVETLAAVLGVRAPWLFFGDGTMTEDELVPESRKELYQLVLGLADNDLKKAEALLQAAFDLDVPKENS